MTLNNELNTLMIACWEEARPTFFLEFGEATFKSWLASLKFNEFISGRFVIGAPTRFMRDWIQTHYAAKILEIMQRFDPRILVIDLIVDATLLKMPTTQAVSLGNSTLESGPSLSGENTDVESEDSSIQVIGSRLEPRYTFEAFVVGKSNELAHAAALRVAEADTVTFNPLFVLFIFPLKNLCTCLSKR